MHTHRHTTVSVSVLPVTPLPAPTPAPALSRDYGALLREFYTQFNPAKVDLFVSHFFYRQPIYLRYAYAHPKVGSVDSLLKKYKGKEEKLLAALCKK